MYKDVVHYVNSCEECQLQKVPRQKAPRLLGYRPTEGPWTNVCGDVMGPFPASYGQKKYLVMFVDNFTKYVEMKAIPSSNAVQILKAFEELVIYRWGCPKVFLADNGTEFFNKAVTERLKALGIHQSNTPAYHPQANPTERSNETLKTIIKTFIENDHRNWDIHLSEFAFAMNIAEHASSKYTPAFLNFGRNPLPAHFLRKSLPSPFKPKEFTSVDWANRMKRLSGIRDLVFTNLDLAFLKQEKYYNKHHRSVSFDVGEKVVRKNHQLSKKSENIASKLTKTWRGECYVVKKN